MLKKRYGQSAQTAQTARSRHPTKTIRARPIHRFHPQATRHSSGAKDVDEDSRVWGAPEAILILMFTTANFAARQRPMYDDMLELLVEMDATSLKHVPRDDISAEHIHSFLEGTCALEFWILCTLAHAYQKNPCCNASFAFFLLRISLLYQLSRNSSGIEATIHRHP